MAAQTFKQQPKKKKNEKLKSLQQVEKSQKRNAIALVVGGSVSSSTLIDSTIAITKIVGFVSDVGYISLFAS